MERKQRRKHHRSRVWQQPSEATQATIAAGVWQTVQPMRIAEELQVRLGLKIQVTCVDTGSLPRFEGKGQRFIDERGPKV